MLAAVLMLFQDHDAPTDHGAGAHETPALVEWINHQFGPLVLGLQRAVMPRVYGLFGAEWHEPAPGSLIIPEHVVWTIVLMVISIAAVLLLRRPLSVDRPSNGQQLLEIAIEQIRGLLDQVVGPYGRRYVPVVGTFAIFILIGNLMGLIPGLGSPTLSINVTGALGLTSFLYYISMGFRQQGLGYLKHFTGGLSGALLPTIGILIFLVEIISNSVRPITLSLRLFVNIFADHEIARVFLTLAPWIVPVFTIVLGVFVAFVQTFIFIMLSMVYLSETVPHEEHDHEAHARESEPEALAEAH